jgi:hypothetical protein
MRHSQPQLPGSGPTTPHGREPEAPPPDPGSPPHPEPTPLPDPDEPPSPRPGDPVPRWKVHSPRFGRLHVRKQRHARAR